MTERQKYLLLRKAVNNALHHLSMSEYSSTDIERAVRCLKSGLRQRVDDDSMEGQGDDA